MKSWTKPLFIVFILLSISIASCNLPIKQKPPGSSGSGGSQANPQDPQLPVLSSTTSNPTNNSGPLKPICFLNVGVNPVTVMAWTYVPLNSTDPAVPSNASTVSSPGGNTSACLSLPYGTYTWCYHWELGDVNGDGNIDYAHSFIAATVTLDESDTDDMDLAEKITLNPAAGTGEQPGFCDMNQWILLDIRPFISSSKNIDRYLYGYSMLELAHNEDFVILEGPITVDYYFTHCDAAPCSTPLITEPKVRVSISEGSSQQFYLEDTIGEHLGNWDLYIQLVSIDK